MNLSKFSVHHPVFITMVTLMIIIMGGVSFIRLPIDLMPEIENPTITISSHYENASAEEMEELITRPIEEAMSAVPGVEQITSSSSEGQSNVRVLFSWGKDLDAASNDIRDRLDRVVSRLPDDMTDRPTLRKFDISSFPILTIGVSSKLNPVQMRTIIENQIKYRIERIPGVASLNIRGGLFREIHVNLLADKVKALGLPLDMIINRIKAENVNVPAGTIYRGNYEIMFRTPGEYVNLNDISNTVVAIREGVPIQLKEIASIEDSWQKVRQISRVNGEMGIQLSINKESGKNTVEVAKLVLEEVKRINQDFPQFKLIPTSDSSSYIQTSISNVCIEALQGGILAVLILLFFLRNIRSTTIITTAIPISIIATFLLMYSSNFTLNLMTLGGLALGIGRLIDDSIVVLENIYRLRESGVESEIAAIEGSNEVVAAITASTLTTVVVFLPLIFVKGMAGIMFKQLAIVISFALLCSLFVARTLVPMLSAKILKSVAQHNPHNPRRKTFIGMLFNFSKGVSDIIDTRYKELLHYSLSHRFMFISIAAILFLGSLTLIPLIGVELMPQADEGEVRVQTEMDVGTRVQVVDEKFNMIHNVVMQSVPELKNTTTSIGGIAGMGGSGTNRGEMRIALKPQKERKRSSAEIADDLRRKLTNIPGMIVRTRMGQGLVSSQMMRMGNQQGTERVQVEIRGHDLVVASSLAERVKQEIEQVEGITDVVMGQNLGNPEEEIVIDRQKAADMKLTVSQIAQTLQTILSGTPASYYHEGGKEYRILVQVKDSEYMDTNEILDLVITNSDGQPVVLRNVVKTTPQRGPTLIQRKDQERMFTISANISGRDMGSIVKDIRERLKSVPVPRDFAISFGGDYEQQQKSFKELLFSFVLALILVYMVIACQYESLRDPFIVMFSVPLAVIGVILILFLTNTTFNIQSFIGCTMLGGIVVSNAILLVDYTNLLRRRDKMPLYDAIEEASRRRLRPILMTALVTILGLTPLAFGLGEGGEAQAPLARAVIGGLTSSTFITLIIIPIVYSLFEQRIKKE